MRDILFKAKRKDNNEWVEGWILKDEVTGQYFIHASGNSVNESDKVNEEGCLRFVAFEVDENTICQYTGLTDKNGNKIWEKDIVKDTDIHLLGSVEYDEEHGMYVIKEVNDGYQNFQEFWSCTEVIGNVFDNPELLNN